MNAQHFCIQEKAEMLIDSQLKNNVTASVAFFGIKMSVIWKEIRDLVLEDFKNGKHIAPNLHFLSKHPIFSRFQFEPPPKVSKFHLENFLTFSKFKFGSKYRILAKILNI